MRILFLLLISISAFGQLPESGSLSLKSAAGAVRSISSAVDGNETGNKSLTTLSVTAGKTAPHSMLEFYGYDPCSVGPDPVTSADATNNTNDITVTWVEATTGDGASQFRIERNVASSPGVWTFQAVVAIGSSFIITDTGLSADTYTYRVRAENACGNSAYVETNAIVIP